MRNWGFFRALRACLNSVVQVVPFYYVKEVVPAKVPASLASLPDGYDLSVFDREDVMAISQMQERHGYVESRYPVDNFDAGDTCLGIKRKGEIVAFTWFSLIRCHAWHHPVAMESHEAYLYDMYVLKPFRGDNLAPILRYKCYEMLERLGRSTFYSITERSNSASLRFKQKLGATIAFTGLGFVFLKKYRWRCILKRY
jgi:hypothetical protein